ncbi:MAG: hypothetical protein ACD_4C00041G0001 [uncultured bacterium (gcode 4)]|uniref:Uncharacterized protein n=1 Tax=uncultured bacterium (gcode 4) TaxID=1234023 RepID=K2FVY4_9BACT|nr:MAG: hypothetical protein ACD_4C00041G0001 [uncultured bacterium (gcode 4)]
MKTHIKYISSIMVTSILVWWMVYAATIDSITTQSMTSGSTVGPGWFQAVNDILNWTFSSGKMCTSNWSSISCTTDIPVGSTLTKVTYTLWKDCNGYYCTTSLGQAYQNKLCELKWAKFFASEIKQSPPVAQITTSSWNANGTWFNVYSNIYWTEITCWK